MAMTIGHCPLFFVLHLCPLAAVAVAVVGEMTIVLSHLKYMMHLYLLTDSVLGSGSSPAVQRATHQIQSSLYLAQEPPLYVVPFVALGLHHPLVAALEVGLKVVVLEAVVKAVVLLAVVVKALV